MFGYVTAHKPELKIKEYEEYRRYYCGLCRALKKRHGFFGRMMLTYDLTFLYMLLSSLYEPAECISCRKCIANPFVRHEEKENKYAGYCADMSLILMYYKLMDDWEDERRLFRRIAALLISGRVKKCEKYYEDKVRVIKDNLKMLSELERNKSADIDAVSGSFGKIMGCLFTCGDDPFNEHLYKMGFFLGKFIYIVDAYEDRAKDEEKGSYNPLLINRLSTEEVREILNLIMSECAAAFEFLPFEENENILRNIIYSGVWERFDLAAAKEKEDKEKSGN